MPDYKNGRIYTVRCRTNNSLIYIGSTTILLSSRFSTHKSDKCCSLYKYIQDNFDGDWSNWYIELYEEYPCDNREQLNRREGEIQREMATINKNTAGRTKKEWYVDNRYKLIEYQRDYDLNHKDKISEYRKEYYIDNKIKYRNIVKIIKIKY